MRMIKKLAGDIECNIREAEEKISTAYRLKTENFGVATWYKDMAAAHLGFNAVGHQMVSTLISDYKKSPDYGSRAEYVEGMTAVWADKHAELTAWSARVKAMIDAFK